MGSPLGQFLSAPAHASSAFTAPHQREWVPPIKQTLACDSTPPRSLSCPKENKMSYQLSTLVGFVGADPEQRIVERWDETDKRNLIETLEACLFLTESKCNVPTQLRAEFGEKQMTLGQYLVFKNRQ